MNRTILIGMMAATALVAGAFWTAAPAAVSNPVNNLTMGGDKDRDTIPDELERELCAIKLTRDIINANKIGECKSNWDWVPPSGAEQSHKIPVLPVPGPDLDNDGLPAYIDLSVMEITVSPFSETWVTVKPSQGAPTRILLDDASVAGGSDSDKEKPVLSTIIVPGLLPIGVLLDGPDNDQDTFPEYATLKRTGLAFDRSQPKDGLRAVSADSLKVPLDHESLGFSDSDDKKPVVRYVSVHVPIEVAIGGDGDNDLLPAFVQLTHYDITVDRNLDNKNRIKQGTHKDAPVPVDANDNHRDSVVTWSAVDKDGDFVVDALEPIICMLQSARRADDGQCVRSDGSGNDGDGDNYVPPMGVPNPWNERFRL